MEVRVIGTSGAVLGASERDFALAIFCEMMPIGAMNLPTRFSRNSVAIHQGSDTVAALLNIPGRR
jgi:hypothetical protein